jgi:hypothetical protein
MQNMQSLQQNQYGNLPQQSKHSPSSTRIPLTRPVSALPKGDQAPKPIQPKDPNAPIKRPRGRPRKDGRPPEQKKSSGSSSDELEIEEEEPEMTPAIISVSMPSDLRGKNTYQAVQAVWSPRNKPVEPDKVRSGIAQFGDIIRSLRDNWKSWNEQLRKAELPDATDAAMVPKFKEEVAQYRSTIESVMQRALLFGHPAIVKRYV